ncbi:MAG: exodeoxyribonuclease V subunit alpha [Balneola sp.]|nr:exodeoxyribonuclease V subunit alpha [Balneola sp.]MBO6710667.1 exodeoxyribonuclease V subunit alpha [Balneola sp.]MBO6799353.1 exodeoxyribonuclease V subunit alpha [Balneola sp.]MBO6869518.1 exodeoxyribonuclease V subunit alpha [Balneola sp.]
MIEKKAPYLRLLRKENEIDQFEYEFIKFLIRNYPSIKDEVIKCALITVKDQLNGNICTNLESLNESILAQKMGIDTIDLSKLKLELVSSEIIGSPEEYKPFILERNNLYLHKYWSYENELVHWLKKKKNEASTQLDSNIVDKVNSLFSDTGGEFNYQKLAVFLSLTKSFLIISGGPGTGKTYTAKKIIEALRIYDPLINIALAAPTGKAADRLNESISDLNGDFKAVTLHRLLGARSDGEFRFNENEKLLQDVIIIDEASMLDIRMWVSMLRALKSSARLIFLGDKDQLSSVEAGSVLGDICFDADNYFTSETIETLSKHGLECQQSNSVNILNDNIVLLNKSYRSELSSGIPQLAKAINKKDLKSFEEVIRDFDQVQIIEPDTENVNSLLNAYSEEIVDQKFDTQFLCSNKKGVFGAENLNRLVESKIKSLLNIPVINEWYAGRRIMITKNDPILGLSNGEIGRCILLEDNSLVVKFSDDKEVKISELQNFSLAYAITIHKSQGSEFKNVSVFLSDKFNPVLSKELLYTGVTRAKENALVIGKGEIIKQMIFKEIKRSSAIPEKIQNSF